MYQDYLDLLQCLNDNKVKYLVIGGYAVVQYAEPRYTKDLDIWIEASVANAKKLLKALKYFGAPIANLTIEELAIPGLVYVFGIPPVRVDVLNKVSGRSFETAWKSKQIEAIEGIKVNFVSKQDLIILKKAAGRPQDLADIQSLKKRN
jgi:predicted nucleotidyltransferase